MIDRYARPKMSFVWSLENQYKSWLAVEIAVVKGWVKEGHIPSEDLQKIRDNAKFDVDKIAQIELVTRHDMVAFTRNVSESLGDEKKWIHYGLTSTDVVDTAQALRLKQANEIILEDLVKYEEVVKNMALKYKDTVMMGRTHGVHAEPTTFGLKIARFYAEATRNIDRFKRVAKAVETGKLSGAVGTFANVPMSVEEVAMEELGLQPALIGSQVLPRDLHADYLNTLGLIATSLENFATEIRSLQRSEIHEVEEGFGKGQKGSSAMPHKRNPIGSENITGLARVVRGHMVTGMENISLWHERDISHSGAERIVLADTTILVDYMLNRFTNILNNLVVFPDTMIANMHKTYGLIYSQRVLLKLIDAGLSREQAYDTVQPLTAQSWDNQVQFRPLIEENEIVQKYLTKEDVEDAFDYNYHLKNVDNIFKRLGLIN